MTQFYLVCVLGKEWIQMIIPSIIELTKLTESTDGITCYSTNYVIVSPNCGSNNDVLVNLTNGGTNLSIIISLISILKRTRFLPSLF